MHRMLLAAVVVCFAATAAMAQDPVKVDPAHYKVEFENSQVRVLRFHYGPHEKSVMHSHPNLALIQLTDMHSKFTMPDGKSVERSGKAGETIWMPAETHLVENLSDQPTEGILVELKGRAAPRPAAKPAAKSAPKPAA
ncbi:MAG: cytoplasmic protein [Candidatus Acidiferrales bacterium]